MEESTPITQKKHSLGIIARALVVVAVFFAGTYVGYSRQPEQTKVTGIMHADTPATAAGADFEPFWKAWSVINEKYPSADKVTGQDRVWGAISGLAASLDDPYTVFFPPAQAKDFNETLEGAFGGVGMELGIKDKVLTVIAPLKGTPADRAGIKSGDRILKIDSTPAADISIDEAITLVRGTPGTKVTITIFRDGENEPQVLDITREKIQIPVLDSELRTDGIFVIHLYSFSVNSDQLFADAIDTFRASGSDKLILDLRGNPGGYLEAAVDMASWFLPSGSPVVIEDYGSKKPEEIFRSKGYQPPHTPLKMIILVDKGSASASEILAGALREQGVATLLGDTTYGKGSVQELIDITADSALKVTVAKWLTPHRISISEKGIDPDVKVAITPKDVSEKKDVQFEKAIELIKK